MFFGSIDSAVELCWAGALDRCNINDREVHFEDLSNQEAKVYLVVARAAYKYARDMDMPAEVLDSIISDYDQLFEMVLLADGELRKAVLGNRHKYLGGFSEENVKKYQHMAGLN